MSRRTQVCLHSRFAGWMIALLVGLACLVVTDLSRAADWPHWRGAGRNGVVVEDSGWDRGAWPLGKPAWTRDVGQGSTSPLVVGGKLYTLGSTGAADRVVCLDAATGKTLWTQMYRCPLYGRRSMGDKGMYSGPSATPEIDTATGYLYTLSTDGDLNCWDTAAKGRRVWGLNLYDRYSVPRRARVGRSGQRDYGYTCAPLVWKDWLIVEVGAEEAAVIAFDNRTGREVWRSQARDSAGHAAAHGRRRALPGGHELLRPLSAAARWRTGRPDRGHVSLEDELRQQHCQPGGGGKPRADHLGLQHERHVQTRNHQRRRPAGVAGR